MSSPSVPPQNVDALVVHVSPAEPHTIPTWVGVLSGSIGSLLLGRTDTVGLSVGAAMAALGFAGFVWRTVDGTSASAHRNLEAPSVDAAATRLLTRRACTWLIATGLFAMASVGAERDRAREAVELREARADQSGPLQSAMREPETLESNVTTAKPHEAEATPSSSAQLATPAGSQATPAAAKMSAAHDRAEPARVAPELVSYANWILPLGERTGALVNAMGQQLGEAGDAPRLFDDDAWRVRLALTLALVRGSGDELASGARPRPPRELKQFDSMTRRVGKDLLLAVRLYAEGVDQRSGAKVEQANRRLMAATSKLRAMQPMLLALAPATLPAGTLEAVAPGVAMSTDINAASSACAEWHISRIGFATSSERAWDPGGNAPDLFIELQRTDGTTRSASTRDSFSTAWDFPGSSPLVLAAGEVLTVRAFDRDLAVDDLVDTFRAEIPAVFEAGRWRELGKHGSIEFVGRCARAK